MPKLVPDIFESFLWWRSFLFFKCCRKWGELEENLAILCQRWRRCFKGLGSYRIALSFNQYTIAREFCTNCLKTHPEHSTFVLLCFLGPPNPGLTQWIQSFLPSPPPRQHNPSWRQEWFGQFGFKGQDLEFARLCICFSATWPVLHYNIERLPPSPHQVLEKKNSLFRLEKLDHKMPMRPFEGIQHLGEAKRILFTFPGDRHTQKEIKLCKDNVSSGEKLTAKLSEMLTTSASISFCRHMGCFRWRWVRKKLFFFLGRVG